MQDSSVQFKRGQRYVINAGSRPGPLHAHQSEALEALERTRASPLVSGILCMPTGSGKTRVALEYIARSLHENPRHRFVWATYGKDLTAQTMARAEALGGVFPSGTTMVWATSGTKIAEYEDVKLVLVSREHLRKTLDDAHDQRSNAHPWRAAIERGLPLTLIYDESHQLGAEELQSAFRKFYRKVVTPNAGRHRFRVVGLSATPVPTSETRRALLQTTLFPPSPSYPTVSPEWQMQVLYRVDNATLLANGTICPVNTFADTGFEIPRSLIAGALNTRHVSAPPRTPSKEALLEYAKQFNRAVMTDASVIGYLAESLAQRIKMLGKTIVFVPSVESANKLVASLAMYSELHGSIGLVHSKLEEITHDPRRSFGATPQAVLKEFIRRENEPCVLVNVDMLTEGFDDPKVQTVVLAKLTLSTNRFWQMIGRGTRGPANGGTETCSVIDPIKLMQLYDYTAGYVPTVSSRPVLDVDDIDDTPGSGGPLPVVCRPPRFKAQNLYLIAPELAQVRLDVATALWNFLHGAPMDESMAVACTSVAAVAARADGVMVIVPVSGAEAVRVSTGAMLVREALARLSERVNADFAWLAREIAEWLDGEAVRVWWRTLRVIETLGLRTAHDRALAVRDGRFAAEMARLTADVVESAPVRVEPPTADATPVAGERFAPTDAARSAVPQPNAVRVLAFVPVGATATSAVDMPGVSYETLLAPGTLAGDLACVCSAMARMDGVVIEAEVELAARIVASVSGVRDAEPLRAHLRDLDPTGAEIAPASARLRDALDVSLRVPILRALHEIALADKWFHPSERALLLEVARTFGLEDWAQSRIGIA